MHVQAEWCLVDRSRPKRSNREGTEFSSKRQRTVRSHLESSDECEDVPQIRGGLARPRPPPLGAPPNRARNTASQANMTTPAANQAPQPRTPQSRISIVDSDDEDDDEDWRRSLSSSNPPVQATNTKQPGTTGAGKGTTGTSTIPGQPPAPPNQTPKVANTTTTPAPPQLPTPPSTGQRQGAGTGAVTGTSGTGGTSSTTTTTGVLPPFTEESEILQLYSKLQAMIVIWVEECLPDTFPPDFRQQRPERYWELSGWCRPVSLGNAVLQHRPWAKYVYESWVWRFLHQEIFRHGSLTWAGNDAARSRGGANGAGGAMNAQFESLFDSGQRLVTPQQYEARIQQRAALMDQIRNGLVHPNRHDIITGWLVTEMLVAFHPYFSDVYKPIDHAQNIEVLIRDTKFLVEKARELDGKLRSARRVYDLILGREGAVCRISGVPSPALQRYVRAGNESRDPDYLDDDSLISLIVVPGLVRLDVTASIYDDDDTLTRTVVRHARAFAQTDLLAALRT